MRRALQLVCLGGLLCVAPQLWAQCVTTNGTWQRTAFPEGAETGTFETTFTGEPMASAPTNDDDVLIAVGVVDAFNDGAAIIGFHDNGEVEARNGGAYANDVTVTYTSGDLFEFRVVLDVVAETYDVFVSKNGAAEQQLANDYAFRTDWTGSGSLDGWVVHDEAGSAEFCNFAITAEGGPTPQTPSGITQTPGPLQTLGPLQSPGPLQVPR